MTNITRDQRRRGLVAAISLATIAGIGLSMLYPLLALALEEMGVASTTVGLFATVGSLAALGITPLIPRFKPFGPEGIDAEAGAPAELSEAAWSLRSKQKSPWTIYSNP